MRVRLIEIEIEIQIDHQETGVRLIEIEIEIQIDHQETPWQLGVPLGCAASYQQPATEWWRQHGSWVCPLGARVQLQVQRGTLVEEEAHGPEPVVFQC